MYTNQSSEVIAEEEGLFDELVDEEIADTPAAEETETNESATEGKQPEKVEEPAATTPFLKVKYNKEEKELSQEEAIKYAQMGMNYDNVLGKYNTLNSSLERLAKANGMDVQTYLEQLESAQTEFATAKELEALKKQYPDADEGILKELAETRAKNKQDEQLKSAENQQQEINSKEIENQVNKFNQRYPNLKADELNSKVYDYMQEGYTLLEAYEIYRSEAEAANKKLEEEKATVAKQNAANKARSFGNISSSGVDNMDDFMSGFLSDY